MSRITAGSSGRIDRLPPGAVRPAFGGDAAAVLLSAHAAWMTRCEPAVLNHWIDAAREGECIIYHIGHLAHDRVASAGERQLDRIANQVLALAEQGKAIPVQQRLADGRLAYVAVRTHGRNTHMT